MPPRAKTLSKLTPDLLKRLIPEALIMKYDGMVYDERRPCPRCSCEESMRNDMKEKTFCTVITDDGFRDVRVGIKRFKCKRCGFVFEGKAPFYDGCQYGSPVVDLCLALAASNPYNRVESILMQYGIQVDRDTVKNYAKRFRDRAAKYAGITVMDDAKIGMNVLKILFGVDDVEELKKSFPDAKKYDGMMDETYPRVKGAKKAHAEERYAKRVTGEKQPRFPKSFTLVSSYLDNLKCFASISCRNAPFNGIVANALGKPLRGADAIITDMAQNATMG